MTTSYEAAVYSEDVCRLAADIAVLIQRATADIPERRVRSCITAAALCTAAQAMDGNRFDITGTTGAVASVVLSWLKDVR